MDSITYPRIIDRIKAAIADTVVMMVLMLLITTVFSKFEHVPDTARAVAFVLVFVLYDPVMTSLIGGTVGHLFAKIRVKRLSNPAKNIAFPLALLRFLVKATLGLISLLTITSNKERRAIHDMTVGSIVINKP